MAVYRRYYQRNAALLVLSFIVVAAGVLVLLSTFMTWTSGQTGWNLMSSFSQEGRVDQPGEEYREFSHNIAYSYSGGGYLIFSGLWSLILGSFIALAGLVMLASFSRMLSGLAIFASFVLSAMAIINTVTIVRAGTGMGTGMYVFLISSLVALIVSAMAQSSPFLVTSAAEDVEEEHVVVAQHASRT